MNKSDFQRLAVLRVREGEILLDAGYYSGAYYLLEYAVECALKACILNQIRDFQLPNRGFENRFYQHDLDRLLDYSDLREGMTSDRRRNFNWTVVKDWSEQARYEDAISEGRARNLYEAITNIESGILPWLQTQY